MALLDVLLFVLAMLMARAVGRVIDGVKDGLSGRATRRRGGNVPARGIQMVRDPVCGTYVIPDRAVALADGSHRVFFCSTTCRDQYLARPSTRSGRPEPAEGRTA